MPTTLTGLLVFVVLLLPGFAYLVGKERNGTERRASPFRETVAIVAASVTSEVVVLTLFGVARWLWPSVTPNAGALVRRPTAYLAGTGTGSGHYAQVAFWLLAMLLLATALAYAATWPPIRRAVSKLPLVGSFPHDSTVSAWWILFEKWRTMHEARVGGDVKLEVGCVLDDGAYVSGYLSSFNASADDSPDRDLILQFPIQYRPPGAQEPIPYLSASAVSIAASHIVTMFVGYLDPKAINPAGPAPLQTAVERQQVAVGREQAVAPQEGQAGEEPGAEAHCPAAVRPAGPSPHR
jgi:hypothetical protein